MAFRVKQTPRADQDLGIISGISICALAMRGRLLLEVSGDVDGGGSFAHPALRRGYGYDHGMASCNDGASVRHYGLSVRHVRIRGKAK
jgi:hypothetical protein